MKGIVIAVDELKLVPESPAEKALLVYWLKRRPAIASCSTGMTGREGLYIRFDESAEDEGE